MQKRSIEVDGYTITYLAKKKALPKTIIAIHGLNDTKETWLPFVGYLNLNYQTILIDLLGSGESDAPLDFDYSLTSQAKFLEKTVTAIIQKESIQHFTLIGHSMGGGLCMMNTNSFAVEKLILVAPLAIHTYKSYIVEYAQSLGDIRKIPFFNVCSTKRLEALSNLLFYKKPKSPQIFLEAIVARKCKKRVLEEKKILALIDTEEFEIHDDLTEVAKNIKAHTLIIWGNRDKILHPKNAFELKKLIPNVHLEIFQESGHMVQLEYPNKFATQCEKFLSTPL